MARYVFVTGGVVSSLGKGLSSAALASLLQLRGFKVRVRKLDPYLNVDPGTMNPFQHGEVFVTDDGAETDLDIGHYERFTGISETQSDNITTGGIYSDIIQKERRGDYLGGTVQVVPHVTDRIKKFISQNVEKEDFIICEIGGTVGDIESLPFLEAIRQFSNDIGKRNSLFIHLTLVPYLKASGELKTKPTQHSVKKLLEAGIQPDILVCRSEHKLSKEIKNKLALFCNVSKNSVIESIDAKSIYDVPVLMRDERLHEIVLNYLNIKKKKPLRLSRWKNFLKNLHSSNNILNVAIIGKYVSLHDAYKSISESLIHAGANLNSKVEIKWILSENLNEKNIKKSLKNIDGVIVAPGFGERGVEGKICAIKYVREKSIPFFGICLGMQCACIEFSRNVLGHKKGNSTEFDKNTPYPIIDLMKEQKEIKNKGGTMRLGSYKCSLEKGSHINKIYKNIDIKERHRHRYEFNNSFKKEFNDNGMLTTGINNKLNLVEVIELNNHPWFIGTQFHPEYRSRVLKPHPLFISFVKKIKSIKNG